MMTLRLYLLRQVLSTLLVTVAVFTFILLLGNVLHDVLDLLASPNTTIGLFFKALALLIPFVLSFSLPIASLTATLLVFGRFSAEQELTAARAGGISLVALVSPVLGLSVGFALLCAVFNCQLGPAARIGFKRLRDSLVRSSSTTIIGEGRYIDLGDVTLYAHRVKGDHLEDVKVFMATNGICTLSIAAEAGEVQRDTSGSPSTLLLKSFQGAILMDNVWQGTAGDEYSVAIPAYRSSANDPPELAEMTWMQLSAERKKRLAEGLLDVTPVKVHMHRQVAFSFACIGFTLIGVPLGIRAHRRETNIGVAMALLLMLVYYSFFVLAMAFETKPQMHPHLLVWVPNFLFQGVGAWLLWRADRVK
jgi:lipopolysaccharide export system permease protein